MGAYDYTKQLIFSCDMKLVRHTNQSGPHDLSPSLVALESLRDNLMMKSVGHIKFDTQYNDLDFSAFHVSVKQFPQFVFSFIQLVYISFVQKKKTVLWF